MKKYSVEYQKEPGLDPSWFSSEATDKSEFWRWLFSVFRASLIAQFFGRNDAKAETPVLWPPHAKSWLIGKDPDAGRDWGQEEKETTGWDGWMASPTRWTWVWVNSGSWWWTGRHGVLRWGLQRVGQDWETELNWTDSSVSKESACNAGDLSSIPGLETSPGEGKATHSSILA